MSTTMTLCPCGSKMAYAKCCEPIHRNHALATKPEQLMRARYSAHVLKLVDFVVSTYHLSCNAENERSEIASSVELNWIGLDIISAPRPANNAKNIGYVEFKAHFRENDREHCMQERSRFIKEDGLWYYIDGVFPE